MVARRLKRVLGVCSAAAAGLVGATASGQEVPEFELVVLDASVSGISTVTVNTSRSIAVGSDDPGARLRLFTAVNAVPDFNTRSINLATTPDSVVRGDFSNGDLACFVPFGVDQASIALIGFTQFGQPILTTRVIPGNSGPGLLEGGDFDGDGVADDLALLNVSQGSLDLLLDDGDGPIEPFPLTAGAWTGLAAADFNGDGAQDLAVSGDGVSILLSDGQNPPAFSTVEVASPSAPFAGSSIIAADINGDGDVDLIESGPSGAARVLLNSMGPFQEVLIPAPTGTMGVSSVDAADIDGDGTLDPILCYETSASTASLYYFANGGGATPVLSPVLIADALGATPRIAAIDASANGRPDIAVGESGNGRLVLLRNGRFFERPRLTREPRGTFLFDVGEVITLTAEASGDEVQFEWLKNGVPVVDGPFVSGATTAAITFDFRLEDTDEYTVRVFNPSGEDVSESFLLAVRGEPCRADQNEDGLLNGADFNAWLANFNAGCD